MRWWPSISAGVSGNVSTGCGCWGMAGNNSGGFRGGGQASALGFLEMFRPAAAAGSWLEPQAGVSRVLRDEAESAAADQTARAAAGAPLAGGTGAAKRCVGGGFHE